MVSATILHTEWSNGWGGQEIRILEEGLGIAERGHRVLVAARPECQILAKAGAAGLLTRALPMRGALDLRSVLHLRALIRAERVAIVNTHSSVDSWIGAWATRGTHTKLIRTRHLSSRVPRHALNFIYRLPDAVITTGEAVRKQLIEAGHVAPERVLSIPTGVNVDYFSPEAPDTEAKRALALPAECQVVSIVAVLRRFKRHDLFLDAAALLRRDFPNVRFLIVGEGPQRPNIEELIRMHSLNDVVTLTGHRYDVRPILSFSAVVVLSSDSGEGVPQSLTQALAMGRPVVGTDVGSVREVVENEVTGLLVPPLDARSLAGAIGRMLGDTSFAGQCGQRGRQRVCRHYSREAMIDRTLRLYERLLA